MSENFETETRKHMQEVGLLLSTFAALLMERAALHDLSKLEPPEREIFEAFTPRLAGLTYGSEEYKQCLEEMRPALENHYRVNRHHPEHYIDGVSNMDLIDLVEMFCDWVAASKRHKNGNLLRSVELSVERFGVSYQLAMILANSVPIVT